MHSWFRRNGPYISAVTLATYVMGLVPIGSAWAAGAEDVEMYEADLAGSASGEYTTDTKATLEAHLERQSGGASAGAVAQQATEESPVPQLALDSGATGSTFSPQAISLPSGAATMAGMGESFTAQLTTGVAGFNVPFTVPAGRVGLSPSLGLVYASSSGYGLAGVGWSLAGPIAIARQSDRGIPGYDDRDDWHPEQDRFILGGQELVPICKVTSGECAGALQEEVMPSWSDGWQYFRSRVEGAFLRVFWSPDHLTWRIQSKAGMNMELGMPLDGSGYADALERNPSNPSEIYRWHLARQYDAHGAPNAIPPAPVNLIQFRYLHDGNVAYLSDVYYTPLASEPGTSDLSSYAHHVALGYEVRPDRNVSYRSGWLLEQRIRLSRVDVTSKPFSSPQEASRQMVRRFHLEYEPTTHASLLTSVAMEGRCSEPVVEDGSELLEPTSCPRLPAMTLEYQRVSGTGAPPTDSQGLEFERFTTTLHEVEGSPEQSLGSGASLSSLMDVNSDGLPDVLVTNPTLFGGNHGVYFNRGAINDINGNVRFAAPVTMAVTGVSGVDANVLKLSNSNVAGLDYDGNGTADLVHMPMVRRYSVFEPKQQGSQWIWQGRTISTASGQDLKINFAQDARRTAVMDVDGDGLADVVFASATEYQTFFALGRYPRGDGQFGRARWTGPDTADISNDPVTACTPWSAAAVRLGDPDVRVADINGDGLPDIVRIRSGQIMYWPGRGNGYWGTGERNACPSATFGQNQHIQMHNAPRFGTTQAGSLHLADVNGDGLADLIEMRRDAVDTYLNDNGLGFTDRQVLTDVPIAPATSNPVRLTDINGSGSVDLLWGQGHEYKYIDVTGGIRSYLLSKVHNGLGKTTELEYRSSTELMVEAAENGQPWASTMPLSTPVVVRATVKDNLEKVGLSAGGYVTEYSYRDPVFDGRQREFRGFRTAETRTLGDVYSPTAIVRSTHLLGECEVAQNGFDACAPADRWHDNWREPLKGLPIVTETFDERGAYLSTDHVSYELRQLYAGRDGRRVTVALPIGTESFVYDSGAFDHSASNISLPALEVNLAGIEQSESRQVTRRATNGTARLRTATQHDDFGNATSSTAFGCVAGCLDVDEAITSHATTERVPGDTSGWLWRGTEGFVTGSVHTEERRRTRHEYDEHGDLKKSFAALSGTLPLDRFHESSEPVAPAPPNASGGVSTPIEVEMASLEHDAFGNVVERRGPNGRCSAVELDGEYAELPVEETVFGGDVGAGGCGERAFVTGALYDRGLAAVLGATSITGQPSLYEYDGFGRLTAETDVDPDAPGVLAVLPSKTYEYVLPSDWTAMPYSIVVVRAQDGETVAASDYHERFQYADGLGRPLVVLSEADPSAGDEGGYVVGGRTDYTTKGQPLRSYENRFWSGDPLAYPLHEVGARRYASQSYDAFGRPTQSYGLDGQLKLVAVHHALSVDRWDAADLIPGPHSGTFGTLRADGHGRQVEAIERARVSGELEERRMVTEYLPTGEVRRVTQIRAGSPNVARWMRYDSLGRLVLNVEPNTSVGFDPDPSTDPATLKAWRYAYNDAGDLVGTSGARGCGVNYHYDAAGRPIAEDYSPCLDHHAAYTAPDFTSESGIEVLRRYDVADSETGTIEDAAERTLEVDVSLLWGRSVSVSDLGGKSVVSYDARGRVKGFGKRIVKPGAPDTTLAERYAPRWYIKKSLFDAAGRGVEGSTGASSSELMGTESRSVVRVEYSARGILRQVVSSYGTLVQTQTVDANGMPRKKTFGDAAATERVLNYDGQRRLRSVQTYRGRPEFWEDRPQGYTEPAVGEPTQQLLLEDYDLEYDAASNVTRITDWRLPDEWPEAAKPATRNFEYDDLYRLTRATYQYAGGTDSWTSPFSAENNDRTAVEGEPRPSPHVDFDERVLEQRYEYDHLGNTKKTTDNANGFYDRSLGATTQGAVDAGPHQLHVASNRATAPTSARKGDLDAGYDSSGNLTELIVRRDGPCLPQGASCWQRFQYEWDEQDRISRARRWDLSANPPNERDQHSGVEDPLPSRAPDAELRYSYTAGGDRVLKTVVDASSNERHTVYVFDSLELRGTSFEGTGSAADYTLSAVTESVLLSGGVRARLVYSQEDRPSLTSGSRHLFLLLSDYLESNAFVIDHETGELVEYATYEAYGATESNYRPERWGSFREPYKFTGKEGDVEVGLAYFGARYLSLGLGRWMSPDPVTIHELRSDSNPYAYVMGRPLVAVDPRGEEPFTAIALGVVIGAVIGATMSAGVQAVQGANFLQRETWRNIGISALVGGVSGLAAAGTGAALGVSATVGPTVAQGISMGGMSGLAGGLTRAGLTGEYDGSVAVAAGLGALTGGLGAFAGGVGNGFGSEVDGRSLYEAAGEAVLVGAGQGGAAYGFMRLSGAGHNLALTGAAIGAANGVAGGAAGIYDFSTGEGWAAAGLDATWGLGGTALGGTLALANVGFTDGAGSFSSKYSYRQNRFVFEGGVAAKQGYVLTLGNTVSSFGNSPESLMIHEDVHIWQSRILGPGYWAGQGGFYAGGALVHGAGMGAYYSNFFEVQGYAAQVDAGGKPPGGAKPRIPWL